MEAQQDVVEPVSVDQVGILLFDFVVIPDEVCIVLDGRQVACPPPVSEVYLLQILIVTRLTQK